MTDAHSVSTLKNRPHLNALPLANVPVSSLKCVSYSHVWTSIDTHTHITEDPAAIRVLSCIQELAPLSKRRHQDGGRTADAPP